VTKFWSKYLNMRFRTLINQAWEKESAVASSRHKLSVAPLVGPVTMESNTSRLKAIDWDRTSAAEIEEMEKKENIQYCKFREHVKVVIEKMARHPKGKAFDKPVDGTVFKDYHKLVQEPLCLSDMREKNVAKKYETEKDVEADFKRIGENWGKYYTAKPRSNQSAKTEKEFVDLALLSLMDDFDGGGAEIISDWAQMREQRDSRRAWRERKAAKQAPVAPTIRQSSRLLGILARGEDEYGPDEFHSTILLKLQQTARNLKSEVTLPLNFSTTGLSERMSRIERNTTEPLEGMGDFIEALFRMRQEHTVLSKLIKKPVYPLMQEVCKQFCAAAEGLEE
jgi:hypothetical protein